MSWRCVWHTALRGDPHRVLCGSMVVCEVVVPALPRALHSSQELVHCGDGDFHTSTERIRPGNREYSVGNRAEEAEDMMFLE